MQSGEDTANKSVENEQNQINEAATWHSERTRERRERLKISSILPKATPPIKIRVFFGGQSWISIKSLCHALFADPKFDVLIVMKWKTKKNDDRMKSEGINYTFLDEYHIEQDSPDIAVLQFAHIAYDDYSKEMLLSFRKHAKLVIVTPYLMVKWTDSIGKHINKLLDNPLEADAYILDKLLYSEAEKEGQLRPNIVHIGNSKFDAIYNALINQRSIPSEWKKLTGKKVFLWATDHWALDGNITFDLYASYFLSWFKTHNKDCALIIRPHPLYVSELLKEGLWEKEDYKGMKKYCDDSPNVIWDEQADYTLSYSLADCVFTDVNCGIILSALVIDKPVCVLRRFDGQACEIAHPDVIAHHNVVGSLEELGSFLQLIRAGIDPNAELRREALKKYISHYDGNNGMRIKEFIEKMYNDKFANANSTEYDD